MAALALNAFSQNEHTKSVPFFKVLGLSFLVLGKREIDSAYYWEYAATVSRAHKKEAP
ncbi:MAG: hypothetical protein PHS86_05895 [Syntrophaceae bacterium]|nr:hypothetical protein [Syntrophaceae bacterium]